MKNSVGEPLRAARVARGWSVEEVAEKLRISPRYVIALEEGDVDALPELTFVRGYVKSYARLTGIDGDVLLAALAPVDVKAPRQLIGPGGQAARRSTPRAPSFKTTSHRHHWLLGGLLALVAGGWMAWPEKTTVVPETATPLVQPTVVTAPVVDAAPVAPGGVTVEVPLPGAATSAVAGAESAQPATTASAPVLTPTGSAPVTAATPATPAVQASHAGTGAAPAATPAAAPAVSAAGIPRKGLHARFNSTCWVEVRDADNVVIYTRIAMPGTDMSVDGKAPLTVTLGEAGAAEVWYNGDRVVADRFSSKGIARLIVGQAPR